MSLKRIDVLFFGFLFVTTILLLFSWNQTENARDLLQIRSVIFLVSIAIILLEIKVKSVIVNLIRNIYPVLFAGYFYTETVHYNKLFFDNLDPYLIKLEAAIFGFQPSIAFSEKFSGPLFTELMYFGYFTFYFIILSFVFIMYFKRKQLFLENTFKVATALLFFYFVFAVFPSSGPQFYFDEAQREIPSNGFIFQKLVHLVQKAEQPTGAFPSSHVGVTMVILLLARKSLPLFFKICILLTIFLILSTVYIKAHYAIDAIAGFLIAPFVLYLATFLYNFSFKRKLHDSA